MIKKKRFFRLHVWRVKTFLLIISFCIQPAVWSSDKPMTNIRFTVSMDDPASQLFQVQMECRRFPDSLLVLKMPVWTPGYYQRMNYTDHLSDFSASDENAKPLEWIKSDSITWTIKKKAGSSVLIRYRIKAARAFVATSFLNTDRGYIIPAGLFLYINGRTGHPAELTVQPYKDWKNVVTGLDTVKGKRFTYTAPDFDILYDSPILIGNLTELPVFYVKGIPHRFIAYNPGNFDHNQLISDLKKVVETATDLIGHIPYRHYTFIGIGPGQGGIEHLNSTSFSFDGSGYSNRESRLRLLAFLTHEYFHHYNVKRIRPVELGPFDYEKGNRTRQLWISEGLTVYYEYLIMRRAGLISDDELLEFLRSNIRAFESKPGRLYQTLAEASWETWSDGPFGRTGAAVNKTISYYDKGPAVGWLFDLHIRNLTANKKSLDDVMRTLYYDYYLKKNRGFTEDEFRAVCEKVSGSKMEGEFAYIYSLKPPDYNTYLRYAGLQTDDQPKDLPGGWTGIHTRTRNDTVFISNVEWPSPAWEAGIRPKDIIYSVNDQSASDSLIKKVHFATEPGKNILFKIIQQKEIRNFSVPVEKKTDRSFTITKLAAPSRMQEAIYRSWTTGR